MTINKKIVWYEGMTLDPHHFQQWDRFYEFQLNNWFHAFLPFGWGLSEISIEKEALLNGQFQVSKLVGIMQDGLHFNMPKDDALPSSRSFSEHFPATQELLSVFLSIPAENPGGKNCQLDETTTEVNFRFQLENIMVNDENTGSDQRQIGVGRKNYQILFGAESIEGMSSLKICEIMRSPQGEFILNDDFVPPCLSIQSSENLMTALRRLLELLNARSSALRGRRRQTADGQLDVTLNDLIMYWHLSSINSFIPLLNQFLSVGRFHPLHVYDALLSLTGLLSSYSTDEGILPGDLPVYDHGNLGPIFIGIERKIRRLLGDVVPQKNYIQIKLEKQSKNLYNSKIEEASLLKEANFFLVCSGDILEKKPVDELPMKLRIAAPEMINEVLSTATRALKITFSSHPPAGVPSKPGVHYFKFDKQGPFWLAIEKSQAMVIYIPAEFEGLQLELLAVKGVS
ncbi:MAG: type VI secretion system baseplate subunit TssK [Calditrichia bacterium]|nr:type VI secretion system baseplate subunit TssK [Calditrichia bacterium]